MGTSSTFSTSNSHVKYNIKINQNWQSVEGNYSNVSVWVDFWRDNSYTTYGSGTCYCKINGTTYSASISPSQKITNSGITLFSQTLNIEHNSDGSKNLSVSSWISMDTPLTSNEQGFSENLTTIPRATTPSISPSEVTMGNSITISMPRASSSFTHTLTYGYGNLNGIIGTNLGTSQTWQVPLSFANQIPNATSGWGTITCQTYSGNTLIGTKSVNFTANVPSSVVPTISSVTLSENTSGIASKFGCYVQGKSTIKGIVSASGAYSSTIKKYEIKINGQAFSQSNFTTNPLTGSGTCTVKITDSRNRTANQSLSYSVTSYANPTINNFTVVRCNQDGTESDEGAYAKCTLKSTISSVNNKNDKNFQLFYRKLTDSNYTTINLSNNSYSYDNTQIIVADINSEYEFIFKVTDYFSTVQKSLNLGTAFTLVDYNASGRSVAFGRVSTATSSQKKLQIKLDTEIEGTLKINNKTVFDLIYPVGSIYMSANSTNPKDLFGGTWSQWGSGRVPVCVNVSDSSFNTAEKTGGSLSHRHEFRIGMHWWYGGACGEGSYSETGAYRFSDNQYDGWARELDGQSLRVNSAIYNNSSTTTANPNGKWSRGDTSESSNLQPYITCYMWKRTG